VGGKISARLSVVGSRLLVVGSRLLALGLAVVLAGALIFFQPNGEVRGPLGSQGPTFRSALIRYFAPFPTQPTRSPMR
jgi:hypothetical protein